MEQYTNFQEHKQVQLAPHTNIKHKRDSRTRRGNKQTQIITVRIRYGQPTHQSTNT